MNLKLNTFGLLKSWKGPYSSMVYSTSSKVKVSKGLDNDSDLIGQLSSIVKSRADTLSNAQKVLDLEMAKETKKLSSVVPKGTNYLKKKNSKNSINTTVDDLHEVPRNQREKTALRLFVSNLNSNTSVKQLHDIFSKFGPVNIVKWEPTIQRALIQYTNIRHKMNAIRDMNNQIINEKPITVMPMMPRKYIELEECEKNNILERQLKILNVPKHVSEMHLVNIFVHFGMIENVEKHKTDASAIVTFYEKRTSYFAFKTFKGSLNERLGLKSEIQVQLIPLDPQFIADYNRNIDFTLAIFNIPDDISNHMIETKFKRFGEITSIDIGNQVVFVGFKSESQRNVAIKNTDGTYIASRKLIVKNAFQVPNINLQIQERLEAQLYLKNVDITKSISKLRKIMSRFGTLFAFEVDLEQSTVMVQYQDKKTMQYSYEMLKTSTLLDRSIVVEPHIV
ncbi:hypothetical protein HDV02_005890 [Globomyces sp. JEL0801]|nr:hypothetical protein HDV02_005890 [Globomyces sp. JEL0801]